MEYFPIIKVPQVLLKSFDKINPNIIKQTQLIYKQIW